jgi:hypothetical protein
MLTYLECAKTPYSTRFSPTCVADEIENAAFHRASRIAPALFSIRKERD